MANYIKFNGCGVSEFFAFSSFFCLFFAFLLDIVRDLGK